MEAVEFRSVSSFGAHVQYEGNEARLRSAEQQIIEPGPALVVDF
jgi:hypothetical protein